MPSRVVDGVRLHYAETGSGPPALCLVHGVGGSGRVWVRQLEELADAVRVIALDLPGHGESGGDGRRRIGDYATLVGRFVEGLGPGPVVLGGHSMGGAISQAVALERPDLLAGLVLVGTGARLRVLPKILELTASSYPESCSFVIGLGFHTTASEALRDGARRVMLDTPQAVTLGDWRACDAFDALDRVGEIRLPTLVVCGEEDRLTPPKYSRYLAGQIAGARLQLVPGAGHYVQLEQPDAVSAAFRAFLD